MSIKTFVVQGGLSKNICSGLAGRNKEGGRGGDRFYLKEVVYSKKMKRKNRFFTWRVKGSLIIVAALIIGSLIMAAVLYGVGPGSELWELKMMLSGG